MRINNKYIRLILPLLKSLSSLSIEQYNYFKRSKRQQIDKILNTYYEPVNKNDIAKHFGYEVTEKDEVIRYRLKQPYKRSLQEETDKGKAYKQNEEDLEQFGTLLYMLLMNFGVPLNVTKTTKSLLFHENFPYVHFGGLHLSFFSTQGNKSFEAEKVEEQLPPLYAVQPTEVNRNEVYYLKIDKKIIDGFNINQTDKFYMGMHGVDNSSLYFFPINSSSDNFTITTLDSELFQQGDDNIGDGSTYSLYAPNIYIWHEPIGISVGSNGTFRLKIPSPFLQLTPLEKTLIDNKTIPSITTPVFSLSYDMFGNLIFDRLLLLDESHHTNHPLPVIFCSELPDTIDNYDKLKIEDLRAYGSIREVLIDTEL